jgi:hypothetical protein
MVIIQNTENNTPERTLIKELLYTIDGNKNCYSLYRRYYRGSSKY